jgi:hypothetical protein
MHEVPAARNRAPAGLIFKIAILRLAQLDILSFSAYNEVNRGDQGDSLIPLLYPSAYLSDVEQEE